MSVISSIQKAIWFTQTIYPESPMWNVAGYAVIRGELDEHLLQTAIGEILRDTDIQLENSDIAYSDYSGEPNSEDACLGWIKEDVCRKMTASTGLLKSRLFKASECVHFWYVKAHHLIFDGYSMSLFFNLVSALYGELSSGNRRSREKYFYSDYIQNEDQYIRSPDFESDRQFWLNKLSDIQGTKSFYSCFKTNRKDSLGSNRKEIKIDRILYREITDFCRGKRCSVFHYFIATLLVLNRQYGNDNCVIGLPILNRRSAKFKNTLGTFINVIPFYVAISPSSSFSEILENIRFELNDCYRHGRFPLYEVLNELDKGGNIFNSQFSYQTSTYLPNFGASSVSINYIHSGEQQEDLSFHLLDYSDTDEPILVIDYKKDSFEEAIIINLLNHFKNLLSFFCKSPYSPVGRACYLSDSEFQKLIVEFNCTSTEYPEDNTIVDLFEDQVRLSPLNIALESSGVVLTYQELDQIVNRLANYLKVKYAIGQEDRVGIKLERNVYMIGGLLAILKSGAAFVPIDPNYPKERIEYILKDSDSKVVIDENEIKDFLSQGNKYEKDDLGIIRRPADLAYLIYTSGSTGFPKGVMVEHRNVYSFIKWCKDEFDGLDISAVLGITSVCFDLSIFEIFYTLTSGRKLVLLNDALEIPFYLDNSARGGDRILLNTVPGVVGALLSSKVDFGPIRVLNIAGEAIPPNYIRTFLDEGKEIRNLYGPSETTTYSTKYRIPPGSDILIGRPIANTCIYILNDERLPVPIGVIGEIFIGGAGISRGYLNKPKMTSEVFIANPFRPGERMYKTGDLARWTFDGNIDFIGRKDSQIKVRGYRIEPGEIEAILMSCKGIKAALVMASAKSYNEREIVAYIIGDGPVDISFLKRHLAVTLPSYMIPSQIIQMEAFPMTPNGKVDRNLLPDVGDSSEKGGSDHILPRNPIEHRLASIWQEILKIDRVGGLDNFFELGGHSLRVMNLANQIQKELQVRLNLRDLFDNPLLQDQARLIALSEKTANVDESNVIII